jgi:hypothetical protein
MMATPARIILTNIELIPGRRIVRHLGLVQGSTVRSGHVGRDMIVVGYMCGRLSERRHYQSIRRRERQLGARVLVFSNRFPPSVGNDQRAALVSGSVVVSEDYFKSCCRGCRGCPAGACAVTKACSSARAARRCCA